MICCGSANVLSGVPLIRGPHRGPTFRADHTVSTRPTHRLLIGTVRLALANDRYLRDPLGFRSSDERLLSARPRRCRATRRRSVDRTDSRRSTLAAGTALLPHLRQSGPAQRTAGIESRAAPALAPTSDTAAPGA